MKLQALFSSKNKSKKLKCHLQQFLVGALRVNGPIIHLITVHCYIKHFKCLTQLR